MQLDIFAKMAPLLKEKKPELDLGLLEKFFKRYRQGQWIYPSAMQREMKIRIQEVYDILEEGVEAGVLEQNLAIYCPACHRFAGSRFKTIYDIPEEVYCLHCDQEIMHPLQHAIVIYKVL